MSEETEEIIVDGFITIVGLSLLALVVFSYLKYTATAHRVLSYSADVALWWLWRLVILVALIVGIIIISYIVGYAKNVLPQEAEGWWE